MTDEKGKMKLFDEESDAKDDDEDDDFRIRPQYEGPRGLEILEINTELSKRFKLDERFADDFEPEKLEKADIEDSHEVNEEKKKNIRILETILGHEVGTKSADKRFSRKRLIRFDPEDENASQFVKTPETPNEKPKKSKKKKEVVEKKEEEVIPLSTERYIEVCPNLKEILSSTTPFSFSQKFGFGDQGSSSEYVNETISETTEDKQTQDFEKKEKRMVSLIQKPSIDSFTPKFKSEPFFIAEGDPRLKEGIEFFKRPKPLEEIRTEWQQRKERIMDLFKKRRKSTQRSILKSTQRSRSAQMQYSQKQNMVRKNNFKSLK